MIARGDLDVRIPLQDVPAVEKRLIHQANLLGRPLITATQWLVSTSQNIRRNRAEVSDVAKATVDGTVTGMLSKEVGKRISKTEISASCLSSRIRPDCWILAHGGGR